HRGTEKAGIVCGSHSLWQPRFATNMALPGVDARNDISVDVDADDVAAFAGVQGRKGQANLTEADNRDGGHDITSLSATGWPLRADCDRASATATAARPSLALMGTAVPLLTASTNPISCASSLSPRDTRIGSAGSP